MNKKYYAIMVAMCFGSANIFFADIMHGDRGTHGFHDEHEVTIPFDVRVSIPFNVLNPRGKKVLSDSIKVHVSDSPLTITKKLQNYATKKFQPMSDDERIKFGGFRDYGLDPQHWIVYQGTKMFKMFSKEQALIDNYDRFDKKYHLTGFTLTYLAQ